MISGQVLCIMLFTIDFMIYIYLYSHRRARPEWNSLKRYLIITGACFHIGYVSGLLYHNTYFWQQEIIRILVLASPQIGFVVFQIKVMGCPTWPLFRYAKQGGGFEKVLQVLTRREGVKAYPNIVDVINGQPLNTVSLFMMVLQMMPILYF